MSAPTPSDEPVQRQAGYDGVAPPEIPRARDSAGRMYQAGDIIAQKYRLTRPLGEGGMGSVWLARNLKLDVDVAIKLIRHEIATAETAQRLLQEARAAARIGHRSIVRVFDFGETELDDPFIVMEVLTGESLRALLERKGRRLPAQNAVRTLLPIASALVEAHANGIVHRDLKPENIMLVPDTSGGVVPKLLDFGIAKLRRGDEGGDDAASPIVVAGTPDYMSPEQAGGREEVDEGADVWALAVILYESITGRVPFGGPTYAALIFSIMTEEPTPSPEQLAGDAELWSILQQGLAKRSVVRPRMRAFGTALARWALARGIESDVAGTSLAAHWLNTTMASPFSALPPPMPDDAAGPETVIPRAGALPRGAAGRVAPGTSGTETERPVLHAPSRWLRGAGLALAGALTVATIVAVTRPRAPPPPPERASLPSVAAQRGEIGAGATSPAPVTAGATAAPPPGSGAPLGSPASAIDSAAALSATDASAALSASAASAVPPALPAPRWSGRPTPRQPRKSTLPIAKQPNF